MVDTDHLENHVCFYPSPSRGELAFTVRQQSDDAGELRPE